MNKQLLANMCVLSIVAGIIFAFMGKIEWITVVYIVIGTIVASIINGVIIGRKMRKHIDL